MGQLRAAKASDRGAFPASTFVVDDTPPITQCQETKLSATTCTITAGMPTITKVAAFIGIDLAGKEVVIANVGPDDGTYNILSNTDDVLITDHTFAFSETTGIIDVQDVGQVYLTRNESSFTRFIENEAQAHTTKGGQLFTDTPSPPMNAACSDTFDPQ